MKIIIIILLFISISNCDNFLNISNVLPNQMDFIKTECFKDYLSLMRADETNILKMLDSWSKLPTGILDGNFMSLGSYDECTNIQAETDSGLIYGKYCLAGIQFLSNPKDHIRRRYTSIYIPHISICIPHSCHLPSNNNTSMIFYEETYCETKYSNIFNVEDWIVLCLICIIMVTLIASTIYEFYIIHYQKERKYPYFLTFSALSNTKKLFKISSNEEHLGCLNGLRSISLIWIIAGHRYISASLIIANKKTYAEQEKTYSYSYMHAAHISVDTFFLISAMVVSYTYFKNINLKQMKLNQAYYFYIVRIIRLAPALYMVYIFSITLIRRIGSGPIYRYIIEQERSKCIEWWWSFFTFTQNYFNWDEVCIIPTWYINADFQMHLLVPFIIIPLGDLIRNNRRKLVYVIMSLIIIITFIVALVINVITLTKSLYGTHSHIPGFMLGILLGIILANNELTNFNISKAKNIFMWTLSIVGMLTIVCFSNDILFAESDIHRVLCFSFFTFLWCLFLSWIIFACCTKRGGIINRFLSCGVFQVLNKLNYSMYLSHVLVIEVSVGMTTGFILFSRYEMSYFFAGDMLYTILASYVLTLSVEAPSRQIGNFILNTDRKKEQGSVEKLSPRTNP